MPNKNKQHSNSRRRKTIARPIFLISLAFVVAIGVFFSFSLATKHTPSSALDSIELDNNTVETETPSIASSESISIEQPLDDSNPDGKTPVAYEGANANSSESLTGVITYSAVSSNNLLIRTNIDQYLSSGVCALILYNNGNTKTFTADIIPEASTSTCAGFDIPLSNLSGFSGIVDIKITLTSDDKTGNINGVINL